MQSGDSPYVIAKKLSASGRAKWFAELCAANPQKPVKNGNFSSLFPGEELGVPNDWPEHPLAVPTGNTPPSPPLPSLPGQPPGPSPAPNPGLPGAGQNSTMDPGAILQVQLMLARWGRRNPNAVNPSDFGNTYDFTSTMTPRTVQAIQSFQLWWNRERPLRPLRMDGALDNDTMAAIKEAEQVATTYGQPYPMPQQPAPQFPYPVPQSPPAGWPAGWPWPPYPSQTQPQPQPAPQPPQPQPQACAATAESIDAAVATAASRMASWMALATLSRANAAAACAATAARAAACAATAESIDAAVATAASRMASWLALATLSHANAAAARAATSTCASAAACAATAESIDAAVSAASGVASLNGLGLPISDKRSRIRSLRRNLRRNRRINRRSSCHRRLLGGQLDGRGRPILSKRSSSRRPSLHRRPRAQQQPAPSPPPQTAPSTMFPPLDANMPEKDRQIVQSILTNETRPESLAWVATMYESMGYPLAAAALRARMNALSAPLDANMPEQTKQIVRSILQNETHPESLEMAAGFYEAMGYPYAGYALRQRSAYLRTGQTPRAPTPSPDDVPDSQVVTYPENPAQTGGSAYSNHSFLPALALIGAGLAFT